nr:extensin-like [Lolium perenne]
MTNWLHNPKNHKESKRVANFIELFKEKTNLSSDDIDWLFLSRRVLPLQRRAHKMSKMSGQRDPTRMTTFSLSPKDLILKAKKICRNTLWPDGKYGRKPYSCNDPPPRDNFSRIVREELPRYAPKRQFPDDADPDPYVRGPHQMGPTQSRRPASHSAATNAQVHEHVAPLAAEVRQEFLDTLAQGGQAPKHRKNKAPAENAGPSRAPPTKRQKKGSLGPYGRKRRHEMPTAAGPPLVITRSAPGIPLEASEDPARTSPPPRSSSARSGAGKAPSSLRGGNTNSGCAAPNSPDHRAEENFVSPPEYQDTGASDMGADIEYAGWSEPPVPPVQKTKKKTKKTTSSPSKPLPKTSAPAAPSPVKDTPAPPPAKDAPAPPPTRDAPAPPRAKDAPAPPLASPAGTIIDNPQV